MISFSIWVGLVNSVIIDVIIEINYRYAGILYRYQYNHNIKICMCTITALYKIISSNVSTSLQTLNIKWVLTFFKMYFFSFEVL